MTRRQNFSFNVSLTRSSRVKKSLALLNNDGGKEQLYDDNCSTASSSLSSFSAGDSSISSIRKQHLSSTNSRLVVRFNLNRTIHYESAMMSSLSDEEWEALWLTDEDLKLFKEDANRLVAKCKDRNFKFLSVRINTSSVVRLLERLYRICMEEDADEAEGGATPTITTITTIALTPAQLLLTAQLHRYYYQQASSSSSNSSIAESFCGLERRVCPTWKRDKNSRKSAIWSSITELQERSCTLEEYKNTVDSRAEQLRESCQRISICSSRMARCIALVHHHEQQ